MSENEKKQNSAKAKDKAITKQEDSWKVQVWRRNHADRSTCVLLSLTNVSRMFSLSDSFLETLKNVCVDCE